MNIMEIDSKYVAGTYARQDVVFVEGEGSLLKDENGKEYIDFGTGIAVNTFGIADRQWQQDVCEQMQKLQHTSNLYYSTPQAMLAQLLCEKTGMKKVFFSNSGAEANECMIKAARKYSSDKYGVGRHSIITLNNSFHGRTVTTLAATGQDAFHTNFAPFTEGFVYAEPGDIEQIYKLAESENPCGIMIELVQGEGGVTTLGQEYVAAVAKICEEKDILLLIDEVQTGNGRTGALYAFMKYGLSPDIVSTAKGLAGGLPIGATMFGEKTENVLGKSDHGSTFGGNPISAAGALSILNRIDQKLLSEVEEMSRYIVEFLSGVEGVKSVSGMGLMLGIETEKPAGDIVKACLAKGLVVLTAKTRVRLLPALNIPMETLKKGLLILKEEIEG